MEELKKKLDQESYEKLKGKFSLKLHLFQKLMASNLNITKGYPCPVDGCEFVEDESLRGLKQHIRVVHNLNTSRKNTLPFLCKYCGSLQSTFWNLKRHFLSCRPPNHQEMGARFEEHIPEPQSEPMDVDPATEDTNEVIKNPFFYMAELSKDVFLVKHLSR